jgi:SAM-dependent methyltransferase
LSYPERILPDETEPGVVAFHLKRYDFALPWCEGREVLDVACGAGYGTALLATVASRVVGGDVDAETIEYARRRYAAPNVEYVVADAMAMPFDDRTFDTFCSFETVEHVPRPESVVAEAARVLRDDGAFLVSTPQVAVTTRAPDNPFHEVELSRADFEALLRARFDDVELYGQRRLETLRHRVLRRLDVLGLRRRSAALRRASAITGTRATEHAHLDDVVIAADGVERASVLYAVCRRPRR